jgi:tRNA(Ile)-lysidine synthase
MLEKIAPILQNECRLDKDRLIVVGVSGGPDSLCLLEALRQAGYPLLAAHFNHQLRPESDAEAGAVAEVAARLKIAFVGGSEDVRAHAEKNGQSIEEAARHLRYTFLFEQARLHGPDAQAVAVGHTADDQVETVLMHFLRGAGLNGLKGMPYRTLLSIFDESIPLVRPLLDIWRAETVAFCEANGLQPHYDPSNASLDYLRNRLRNTLIPDLESYNPKFRQAAWRATQTLRDDHAIIQELLDQAWDDCLVSRDVNKVVFEESKLMTYPLTQRRRLVRRAVEALRAGLESTYATLERAARFLSDPAAKQIDLTGGLRLLREEGCIYIAVDDSDLPVDQWPQMPDDRSQMKFSVPGRVDLPGGWRLTGESPRSVARAREQAHHNGDPLQAWLDAEKLPEGIELRVRRQGDRFEPLGMDGHSQKLTDFFVNEKLPQRARARWPLLCAGETILWVPGYRPAHSYRLTAASKKALHFVLARSPENLVE